MAGPTNRLQIVDVKEQIKIALVWFKVVYHSRPWASAASLQWRSALLMLTPIQITQQHLLSQRPPLLRLIQLAILSRLWCAPLIHQCKVSPWSNMTTSIRRWKATTHSATVGFMCLASVIVRHTAKTIRSTTFSSTSDMSISISKLSP